MTRLPRSSATDGLEKDGLKKNGLVTDGLEKDGLETDGLDVRRQTPASLGQANPHSVLHPSQSATSPAPTQAQPPVNAPLLPFKRHEGPCGNGREDARKDGSPAPRDVLAALTYGLDLVRHGAMLVAVEGRPRVANHAALAILRKNDGLMLARTGLVAERATDTRLLQRLLQDAIKSPELGEPKDSPITLQRRTAQHALIVRVVPGPEFEVPGLDCWPGTGNRTALLKLYDQDLGLEVDAGDLCRLYGLTRGEAALAVLLVRGKSIEDAAAELFISPHTARTHLKRIFMKTDTHRQTELVVRILTAAL
jgi:DNA-binding CsgD family transcriptional regulator